MEMVLIIALLVSNVWLIRKVLNKPDAPTPEKPQDTETPPAPEPEEPADIVGTSTFDIREFTDSVREAAKEAAVEAAKEAIPLIVKELGTPADAGLPEESEQAYPKQVPKEDFTKVFSNLSASELTGETPPPAEPNADGIDFEDMRKTMEVIKDKPHTPEDEKTARRVLTELEGTELIEYVKLDPVVRKRILMIECRLPEVEETEDPTATSSEEPASNPQTRKIVFHADIDTTDIDAIDFNILH